MSEVIDISKLCQCEEISDIHIPDHAVTSRNRVWTPNDMPNDRILIGFFDGTQEAVSIFYSAALHWPVNLNFEFLPIGHSQTESADIRVTFNQHPGAWSFVGTDALLIPSDQPTMSLGWQQDSIDRGRPDEAFGVMLHELGHAMGRRHEQHNPLRPWELTQQIYDDYAAHGWDRDRVNQVYGNKFPEQLNKLGPYDRVSVMHYWMLAEWKTDGLAVPYTLTLSTFDKAWATGCYPKSQIFNPIMFG